MAAAVTDKFIKGPANKSSTLSSSISDSVQTIPISDLTGVPTDTAVYAAIDAHDSSGNATPSAKEVVKGVVSGSNLINCTRGAEGTAQAHDAGAVVEFFFTAAANNDIVDGILVEHDQDGTHKSDLILDRTTDASPATDDYILTSDTSDSGNLKKVTLTKLKEWFQSLVGWISTAMLADDAVTPDKMDFGAQSAFESATGTTTSTSYTATLSGSPGTNPSVTVTVPASGSVFVSIGANMENNTSGARSYVDVALSGANTVAASDANAIQFRQSSGTNGQVAEFGLGFMLTGLTAGSTTFTLNYKVSTGTGTFARRRIAVIPIGD